MCTALDEEYKCVSDIDDCIDAQCADGATCMDGINDYTCHCPAGYTGKYCAQGKEWSKYNISKISFLKKPAFKWMTRQYPDIIAYLCV